MSRFAAGLGLSAIVVTLALSPSASAKDYAGTALNIVPSGQYGGLPVPAGAEQQAQMYDALTPLFNHVTMGDLTKDFKPETFGTAGQCPCRTEKVPHPGIKIVRDRYDVPHVTGRNKLDLDWASGWIAEEDRGLLLAEARYPGRFAALDAPGIDAFSLVTSLKSVTVSKQADAIIEREQTGALKARGKEGRALLRDVDEYVLGLNARLKAEKSKQKPFTRVDVYSANALAGQIFGQGGGDETRRSMLLNALQARMGAAQGKTVWDDLTEHMDEDTPTTIDQRFPYEQVPANPTGNAVIDNGSMTTSGLRAVANAAKTHKYASNFLMVSGKRSATGHPLFVAGPQIGYYYPGLTLEMDLKAPGIESRGVAFPGGAGQMLIGRGPDFAWTLTSAGSDTNDQFVETLCGGSDRKYLYKGKCRSMGHVDAGTIAGEGEVSYDTTVHGPVLGYATSAGKRVAISFKRSSHGKDILWELAFRRLTDGKVTGLKSFYAAAATSPFTFNMGYVDDKNIATYSAGALPIRDKRVDPRLPTIGTGQYEWKGFLKPLAHPHEANPASGALVNWNNKPAPGFGSSDSEWTYGSIQRVEMLNAGVAALEHHDLASLTSAMNGAATQDLRVMGTVFDGISGVLSGGPAPDPRDQEMLDLLQTWRSQGGSRVDADGDGKIDAGAAATIMDNVYPRIADAVLAPVLGPQLQQLSDLEGTTNGTKSGFTGGRIQYVDKDLRSLLGTPFKSPFATKFCGGGDLATCRASLWQAFDDARVALTQQQGTADPAAWTSDADAERITFVPGLLPIKIRYTNRPSGIQQVLWFKGHRKTRR